MYIWGDAKHVVRTFSEAPRLTNNWLTNDCKSVILLLPESCPPEVLWKAVIEKKTHQYSGYLSAYREYLG